MSEKMNIILSHAGKQHAYHVAKTMTELGVLKKFFTSSYIKNRHLQKMLDKTGNQFWSRRYLNGVHGSVVDANWRFELKEFMLRRIGGKSTKTQEAVYQRDIRFDNYVASKLAGFHANLFWGFQGSCYDSLHQAKNIGLISVCELATAHVEAAKKILGHEQALHPEWADSIDNLIFPVQYEKRLIREPHIADFAIAASDFTAKSLVEAGKNPARIIKLPLGFDSQAIRFFEGIPDFDSRPVKILYAGTVTQRKGIKYLLDAVKFFKQADVELHIIGGIQGSGEALQKYKQRFVYHPPVSQQVLFREYGNYDVLALPTVFEGFGLVIAEAMATGMPVITTPHSIGPEIITHKKNGCIVPVRDVPALKDSIGFIRNLTGEQYYQMRRYAREAAAEYNWNKYKDRLKIALNQLGIEKK